MRKKPCSTCLIPVNHSNDSWNGIELFIEENPSTPAQVERCLVPTLDHSSFRAELQQHTWQLLRNGKHTLHSFVGRDLAPDLFFGLPLSGLTGHFSGQDAMELHKLAFPDRPQPMLVDEEVGTTSKTGAKQSSKCFFRRVVSKFGSYEHFIGFWTQNRPF